MSQSKDIPKKHRKEFPPKKTSPTSTVVDKDSNLTWILGETVFFSGIWSSFLEYGSNDHKKFFCVIGSIRRYVTK